MPFGLPVKPGEHKLNKITKLPQLVSSLILRFQLWPSMNELKAYWMYLGLSVCCLLIPKIPHIPGEIVLPNLLLPFYRATWLYVYLLHNRHCMKTWRAWRERILPVWAERLCTMLGEDVSLVCFGAHLSACVLQQCPLHSCGGADQHEWHLCERVDLLKRLQ